MAMMMCRLLIVTAFLHIVSARLIVDLTHTFDENAPNYPVTSFGVVNLNYYKNEQLVGQYFPDRQDMWLEIRRLEFYEHIGTHIDAPTHFAKGRQALHEIPPERLIGPGVVIDVRDKARANPDYALSLDDVHDYEKEFGKIPVGAIVMMNSGWSDKYPNPELVFGTPNISDSSTFRYPGFSIEACRMLNEERQVSVFGVDSPSTDPNKGAGFLQCHRYLQPLNVPLLENVANLDNIPQKGTTIFLGAMKVRSGTGGPTRVMAVLDDIESVSDSASMVGFWSIWSQIFFVCMMNVFAFIF